MHLDARGQEDDQAWELICPECHQSVLSTLEICPHCGYEFAAPRSQMSPVPAVLLPAVGTRVEAAPGLSDFYARRHKVQRGEFVYGGFWARVAARLIDGVIVGGSGLMLYLVVKS